ncbi:hypothetical protein JOE50_003223 [Bradyrhizobium japonicum]|nr:hypothetical protein [Bradyrhizobium japonicum]
MRDIYAWALTSERTQYVHPLGPFDFCHSSSWTRFCVAIQINLCQVLYRGRIGHIGRPDA